MTENLQLLEAVNHTEIYCPRAALAALGVKLTNLDLFGPVRKLVTIEQKTVKYRPDQKLYSAFLHILAGGKRMTEINKTVRTDEALQKAFGEVASAEQSVVQA